MAGPSIDSLEIIELLALRRLVMGTRCLLELLTRCRRRSARQCCRRSPPETRWTYAGGKR